MTALALGEGALGGGWDGEGFARGHGMTRYRSGPGSIFRPHESGPLAMTSWTRGSAIVVPPNCGAFASPRCTVQPHVSEDGRITNASHGRIRSIVRPHFSSSIVALGRASQGTCRCASDQEVTRRTYG
jgi:hypothetical protein